jgi:integrase/recombinase XerD
MMNISLDSDAAVQRFVAQLRLRTANTRTEYRSILNGFRRFGAQQSPSAALTRQIIERWLRDQCAVWPICVVARRARLVDRFLDWLVLEGSLPSNPLAQLRRDYGQTATAPIVRALLAADPESALETLRPPPRFASFLGPAMRDYVALMQTMGYRYQNRGASLLRFDRFLQTRPELLDQPLEVLVREWMGPHPTALHAWECLGSGRVLAKALRRNDPTIPIPASDPRLTRQVRQQYRRPYLFTEEEVRRLLDTARAIRSTKAPLGAVTAYTALVLAYCSGLRLGEIARLRLGDINLDDQTVEIRETKFFKSRRLPLAPSVTAALRDYLNARRQVGAPLQADAGLFWHPQRAGQYSRAGIYELLTGVIRQAGFKPQRGRLGPRCHDLRHSFVSNRLLAWYREGVNPQSQLPYLAAYLGHKDINSTVVYLNTTPETLQHASERFHRFAAQALQPSIGAMP